MSRGQRVTPPVQFRAPSSNRCVRFDGTRLIMSTGTPIPTASAGTALVRVLRAGVASPDLAVAQGRTNFAGVMGHEAMGMVEAVGPGDEAHQRLIGKRVVINPLLPCASCETCTRGLSSHCPQRAMMGLTAHDGLWADVVRAPITNLIEVPRKVDDDAAVFTSCVASAMHVAKLVAIESKPFVSVLGDGVMGLLVAQVLARRNASVRLLGRLQERFALCEKWGIKHRAAAEVGMNQDQDVVIDCTGRSSGTELALRLVRPRGLVIVKGWPCPARGVHESGQRTNLSYLLAGEITMVGSGSGAGAGGFAEALRMLEEATIDVHSLMTHRFSLSQAAAALEQASSPQAIKVLLDGTKT